MAAYASIQGCATDKFVDRTNTAGPWDGTQQNPYMTIQDGLNAGCSNAVRVAGGLLSDSIRHRLGYLAVLGRWLLYEGEQIDWSLTFGVGLLARESWRDVEGYKGDNALHESEHFLPGYEWAVLPMGDVDMLYRFSPSLQGVWSIFPGVPYVITQSFGVRWTY